MMGMGMAQGGGDAEMPGMGMESGATGNKVTIEKLPDGTYHVMMDGQEMEEGMEGMAESEDPMQSYQTAEEACQAAIALLDGGGDADAEIMQGYNGPGKQMKKVGVKEVFGE